MAHNYYNLLPIKIPTLVKSIWQAIGVIIAFLTHYQVKMTRRSKNMLLYFNVIFDVTLNYDDTSRT